MSTEDGDEEVLTPSTLDKPIDDDDDYNDGKVGPTLMIEEGLDKDISSIEEK